jgi:uncharacterized lipoprotein YmbA
MPSRRHRSALALSAVSIAALLLTGCAGNNPADSTADTPLPDSSSAPESESESGSSDQSVADACNELQSTLSESATALQDGMSEFANDPQLAVDSLTEFAGEFGAVRDSLGNAEVKAQADKAGAALDEMIVALESGVADPAAFDLTAFTETATNVQTELAAIGEVCTQ